MRYLREEDSSLALAVDGPRGPRHCIQPGIFMLSLKTGKPILPLEITVSRKKCFSSWDRCVFPLPFARITLQGKEMIHVNDGFERDISKKLLQEQLGE